MPRPARVNILNIPIGMMFTFEYAGPIFERVASAEEGVWIKHQGGDGPAAKVTYPQFVNPINNQESDARS